MLEKRDNVLKLSETVKHFAAINCKKIIKISIKLFPVSLAYLCKNAMHSLVSVF